MARGAAGPAPVGGLEQAPNTWVKRSPLPAGPPSPRLGYEGACAWDTRHHLLIRYGGHNQGGGGEQNAETWLFEPRTARWTLVEPNTSPPGICCGQQNVFDPVQGRYLRFPAFSGSHGWQWWRELYLNDSSVWSFDTGSRTWRNLRPVPSPSPRPLRCASWDAEHQVVVLFGGEGSQEGTLVYDPYDNTWTRQKPPQEPPFRSGGNMAYDAARKLHVLFGSQFGDDPHTRGYDLRTNTWRDLSPPSMPPTKENDAVLTYDPLARKVVALVKITEGKDEEPRHRLETWTYDAGANRWTKMDPPREPDPSGNRARVLSFAPELNLAILENRPHPPYGAAEQQIWTYRLVAAAPIAEEAQLTPGGLSVTTASGRVMLRWASDPRRKASPTTIYRSSGERPFPLTFSQVGTVAAGRTTFEDSAPPAGKINLYAVSGKEGPKSEPVRAQPRIIEDGVVSVIDARRVELSWKPAPEADVAGYHVERAAVEVYSEDQLRRLKGQTEPLAEPSVGAVRRIGAFTRLTTAPVRDARFTDTTVDLERPQGVTGSPAFERSLPAEQLDPQGKPYRFAVYAYRIRAVNRLGVESGPSPALFTLPSGPQSLFAREEGAGCRLRWAPNPEKRRRGYRVYRMNGRFDRDPIPRLSPDPVAAAEFEDPNAGKPTRRYYVVAVDALGQEGFPSAPVWYNREWKAFYLPFTGEWHQ